VAPSSKFQDTDRLRIHYIESGPEDATPVLMVHGNLATGRFFEHVMEAAPEEYRFIAPDMRGFGDTEQVPIDATRGLRDWSDDSFGLVQCLGIDKPIHLVGWSTGGAAVAHYAMDRSDQVASITFLDPVSPYGFGGTRGPDGTLCTRISPDREEGPAIKTSPSESPMVTDLTNRHFHHAM
jgi:pimeloyl-ACP methyl ester carboxylesterase